MYFCFDCVYAYNHMGNITIRCHKIIKHNTEYYVDKY